MIIAPEEYANFVGIIKAMIPLAKDIQIVDGKICQRDSDNANWLIMGDLTSIFGSSPEIHELSLYSLDTKSPFLRMFTEFKNDVELTFLEDEQRYKFSDGVSSFTTRLPDASIFKKQYDVGSVEKMEYDPSKLITEFEMDKKLIKRTTTAMQAYGIEVADLIYNERNSTVKLNFGGNTSTKGSFDLLSNLPCEVLFGSTSMKFNILKTSVGDSVSVKLYMGSEEVQQRAGFPVSILVVKTMLHGCPFEYRQKRRVEM